jgi:hypothetical protein
MNAVRGLLRDLVDRRLWPVAVLLLAAAVAVPIYLGKSSGPSDAPPPVAPSNQDAKVSKAAVKLEDGTSESDGVGSVRNPFKQQHVPKSTTSTDTGTTPTDQTPAGGSGSGSTPTDTGTGTNTGGGSGTPTDTKTDTSQKDALDIYHLTLRFGKAGSLKTIHDVARLSPLPSADNPFFVYTGVLKDGKTAVFLLSSDAEATGDGHCRPSANNCQTIEVKQGDTEFFDLKVDGQDLQYQLDVLTVAKKGASSTTAAAASLGRHSKAGAALLRDAHVKSSASFSGLDGYRWLADQGVLVRTPTHSKAKASVNGAAAASATDVDATLPGLPVWHFEP